ncbi:MAG: hypothetical protein HFI29_15735 [Lachnospiraceae bacterium]|jgi:hypothetical protein|nr:hypothetical protein [Lachnospiraceae bacterium]
MPLYEGRHNAENKIHISEEVRSTIAFTTEETLKRLLTLIEEAKGAVALDGWYGVDYLSVVEALKKQGCRAEFINANTLYKDQEQIATYKQPFITDDPGFGYCNMDGRLIDLMDLKKVEELRVRLQEGVVVFGCGAAIPELYDSYALTLYLDKTRQPLLWQMWDGKLAPFGLDTPKEGYDWKEYYYCDYFLLHFQKHYLIERMGYYIEAISADSLKMLPRESYDEIIQTMLKYPIKEVEIYQPGPWGAYRYKDFWDIKGLECNAWNELAGPELSILIDVGGEEPLNMPFVNLMQYADDLVGPYLNETYPHLFPLDAWLDDGYFPEKTPAERISMPIHTHPSTDYVKRHFNEPIGRYETYYIAEAYEGANTWMGFNNEADLEEWERKCRESNNLKEIPDWKNYICNWESRVGDLYLIPPGTDHGHGGNQMVLELDTCPSIAGTEYSFFSYDFARCSWDDNTKTMTGKPVKMHLDHSFNCSKFRREDYVDKKLRAKPSVVKWTKDYYLDRYSSVPEMPFEIERIHYYNHGEYSTEGRFCHIVTLTVGKHAKIYSKADPSLCTEINLFQAAVIPASFGEYVVESDGEGANTVTLVRWKKG